MDIVKGTKHILQMLEVALEKDIDGFEEDVCSAVRFLKQLIIKKK